VISKEYPPKSLVPSIHAVGSSTSYPKLKENAKVGFSTIKRLYYTFGKEDPSNHLRVSEA
jgi:hypothetical protein